MLSRPDPVVEFEAEATVETDLALYCVLESGDERWIPKSVIHEDSEVYQKGHEGTLVVYEWFAEKEELI